MKKILFLLSIMVVFGNAGFKDSFDGVYQCQVEKSIDKSTQQVTYLNREQRRETQFVLEARGNILRVWGENYYARRVGLNTIYVSPSSRVSWEPRLSWYNYAKTAFLLKDREATNVLLIQCKKTGL